MSAEAIKARLIERFNQPLPEFHKRRIVFWNDESGEFADQVDEATPPDVTLIKLTGSNNFAVKKLLTADDLTGDYLIYNPLIYDKPQDNWLLDIELYSGEPFLADLTSTRMEELNIELNPLMRKTVKMYDKFFIEKHKAKLKKIGNSYHTPAQLHTDIMVVLCGLSSGSMQDIIIAVLSAGLEKESNTALENISKYGNSEVFWHAVQKFTGYEDADNKQLDELASHILITALSQTLSVSALKGLERYISQSCTAFCYQLVRDWQHKENNNIIYEYCRKIESKLLLMNRFDSIEVDDLLKSDTFPYIDESIIKRFYSEISEQVIKVDEILNTVEKRRTKAWYKLSAEYFDCLYYIAKMQEFHLANSEGFHIVEPKGIWDYYTSEGYKMDSYYRHFHYAFGKTLTASNSLLDEPLKKCIEVVEGKYHQWYLKELNEKWTGSIAGDMETLGYVSEIAKQREFYKKYVESNIKQDNKVCVVISDALRFEVAAELAENLRQKTKGMADIETVQSTFPSITSFGMAALLPGDDISVNEKLEVLMDGYKTEDNEVREKKLQYANENSVAISYKKLSGMKKTERREITKGKDIIYIYHNKIDAVGDKYNTENMVFDACKDAIDEITAIVKIIVNELNRTYVFITADHGFLYTYEPLDESDKISRQTFNGDVYELGRRYALVSPETTADYMLPVNMEGEIKGKTMKGYTPHETVRIKVQGGGSNYVHGGISLQEMTVPVVVYKGMRTSYKGYVEVQNPGLTLISESRKASNMTFSLDFLQKEPVGEKVQSCEYTLYFADDTGAVVSDKETVIADKTSENASERVHRVMFKLKPGTYNNSKKYRLIIASDTDVPEEIEFRIDIAFADDYGFDF